MRDREREKTQKALEELVKVEYMAISAYEEALAENEDNKLRRRYKRFLRDHERQARDLNNRLVELGGEPVEAGVGSGKIKAGLWGRITGMMGDKASIGGMYAGAKQGIQIYLKHLDDIHDAKALGIIRRNLENKQDEIQWLEEQMNKAADDGCQEQRRGPQGQDRGRSAGPGERSLQGRHVRAADLAVAGRDCRGGLRLPAPPERAGFRRRSVPV